MSASSESRLANKVQFRSTHGHSLTTLRKRRPKVTWLISICQHYRSSLDQMLVVTVMRYVALNNSNMQPRDVQSRKHLRFCSSQDYPYDPWLNEAFWGSNYPRLLDIKRQLDPDDVFWCQACVGHESWKESSDGRLCRV